MSTEKADTANVSFIDKRITSHDDDMQQINTFVDYFLDPAMR